MPDMLMDVDLRKRDSMFEFLIVWLASLAARGSPPP